VVLEVVGEGLVLGGGELRVGLEELEGVVSGCLEEGGVADDVGDAQLEDAALFGAVELAGAAELEVFFGDLEAIGGAGEDFEALAALVGFGIGEEDAVGLVLAATDASAELVELGEAEALRIFDDHAAGVGDIDADFDDDGGDEDIVFARSEAVHGLIFFVGGELAVDEADAEVREDFLLEVGVDLGGGLGLELFAGLDEGADEVGLAAFVDEGSEAFVDGIALGFALPVGFDGLASGGVAGR
jgi:hypothetical protein